MERRNNRSKGRLQMSKMVLVVDDEPNIVKMVEARLKASGYQVRTSLSGEEALKICKLYKPDAVILDIMMPDVDGPAVAEELRDNPETSKIPIIFLTAALRKKEVPDGHVIAGHYFIAKPFKADELISLLKQVLLQDLK